MLLKCSLINLTGFLRFLLELLPISDSVKRDEIPFTIPSQVLVSRCCDGRSISIYSHLSTFQALKHRDRNNERLRRPWLLCRSAVHHDQRDSGSQLHWLWKYSPRLGSLRERMCSRNGRMSFHRKRKCYTICQVHSRWWLFTWKLHEILISLSSAGQHSLGKIRIHGIIADFPVPFPVRPDNACGNWGMSCPLQEGNQHSLELQMPVRRAYPRIPLTVEMKLVSETDETLFCTQFPARIMRADEFNSTEASNSSWGMMPSLPAKRMSYTPFYINSYYSCTSRFRMKSLWMIKADEDDFFVCINVCRNLILLSRCGSLAVTVERWLEKSHYRTIHEFQETWRLWERRRPFNYQLIAVANCSGLCCKFWVNMKEEPKEGGSSS